jgi:hypothetical protein
LLAGKGQLSFSTVQSSRTHHVDTWTNRAWYGKLSSQYCLTIGSTFRLIFVDCFWAWFCASWCFVRTGFGYCIRQCIRSNIHLQ